MKPSLSELPDTTRSSLIVGKYYPEIEGLRAVAVLMVIYFHSSLPFISEEHGFTSLYSQFTLFWWCGVDLFFVISGFLITGILIDTASHDHCFKYFYIRRILRIFPLYYACLFLFFTFSVLWLGTPVVLKDLSHIFYIQNWLVAFGQKLHVPLRHFWSLAIEEQFYLFWPALFLFAYKRAWATKLCVGMLVITVFSRSFFNWEAAHFMTLTRLDGLVLGGFLAYMLNKGIGTKYLTSNFFLVIMAVALWNLALIILKHARFMGDYSFFPFVDVYLLLAVFFTAVIGWLMTCQQKTLLHKFLSHSLMRSIGRVSYGMYIFHWIIITAIYENNWLEQGGYFYKHGITLLVCVSTSYAIAWISFRFFEQPVLNLKERFAPYRM